MVDLFGICFRNDIRVLSHHGRVGPLFQTKIPLGFSLRFMDVSRRYNEIFFNHEVLVVTANILNITKMLKFIERIGHVVNFVLLYGFIQF